MDNNRNNEADWQEFEKTGSVYSYLRYKGVYNTENTNIANTSEEKIRDGEPIGYR